MLYRSLPVHVRGLDEENRTAEFVASTEAPVETWMGPEVLRMSGVRLSRYQANPVVLDTHMAHDSIARILGSASVEVVGRQLRCKITYSTTEEGERAWTLVCEGHLRAVSVGYEPKKVLEIKAGEADGEGESRIQGPAIVVPEWELLEISNVPIPADQDALRREIYTRAINKEEPVEYPDAETKDTAPTPKPKADPPPADPKDAFETEAKKRVDDTRAQRIDAVKAEVRAWCPDALWDRAQEIVMGDPDIKAEKVRELLLQERAKELAAVGTPAPGATSEEPPKEDNTETTTPETKREATGLLARSISEL